MLRIVSAPFPVLVTVTTCGVAVPPTFAPGASTAELKVATGRYPNPVRRTVSVDPGAALASSVTIRLPLRAPGAWGAKVTPMLHAIPGRRTCGQCGVALKSPV